jgi:hypothetical protein
MQPHVNKHPQSRTGAYSRDLQFALEEVVFFSDRDESIITQNTL